MKLIQTDVMPTRGRFHGVYFSIGGVLYTVCFEWLDGCLYKIRGHSLILVKSYNYSYYSDGVFITGIEE